MSKSNQFNAMKNFFKIIFLGVIFLGLTSCKFISQNRGIIYKQIKINNTTREYAFYIPKKHTQKMPLVVILHGGGGTIEGTLGLNGRHSPHKLWLDLADGQNIALLIPQATKGPDGKPHWNDCRANAKVTPNVDDVKFINTAIDSMLKSYDIDSNRIYIYGISNGGLMTFRMLSETPDRFAAAAAIIASFPANSKCSSAPSKPIPIMLVNGTADPLIHYDGGYIGQNTTQYGSTVPVDSTLNFWLELNQCDSIAHREKIDKTPDDNCYIEEYFYKSKIGDDVLFLKVVGGGHTTPSISEHYSKAWLAIVGNQDYDIETVYELWDFFQGKTRRAN